MAVINGDGTLTTQVQDVPELKENEVLIKVHATLISPGTEMNIPKGLREKPEPDKEPITFGYSSAGEIVEVKGECGELKPGMRVAAMGGGFAQHATYNCVPKNLVVPIPDNVTYSQAAYACLGATALQAVRRTEPQLGEYGVVLGQGIVGNLAAQLCQLSGARVQAWEGVKGRIEAAKACGIRNVVNFKETDTAEAAKAFAAPYGMDFAIFAFGGDATKTFKTVKSCMKVSSDTHQMGRIVLVGGCTVAVVGGAASGNLDIRAASRTGAGYHDSAWEYGRDYPAAMIQFTTQRNLREIIQLISEGRLLVDPMTIHFPIEKVGEAADLVLNEPDKAIGVILDM
jgi:NADPH:quinone reductase-like Zn-dependent oxidoreductase